MNISKLLDIMRALRDPDNGCPWDLEQDFASIAPYTIEEAYEVADAIEREALDELPGELGDLLLQVVFHAQLADEAGLFGFDDVVASICEKMIRRHPHVFGEEARGDAARQLQRWEQIKAAERAAGNATEAASLLDGIAIGLPALQRAEKMGGRAARVGFDWPDVQGVLAKLDEERGELLDALANAGLDGAESRVEEELGDWLFTAAQLGRHLNIDPARALRRATAKFERRFRTMERNADAEGLVLSDCDAGQLDAAWARAKGATDAG